MLTQPKRGPVSISQHQTAEYYNSLTKRNKKSAGFLSASRARFESPPPRRRQNPPRQRNPPPIDRLPPLTNPLAHTGNIRRRNRHLYNSARGPGPQHRGLDPQHPANRPQNASRLRGRYQQGHHLGLPQNRAELRPIPRRLPSHQTHRPAKAGRPKPGRPHCKSLAHHRRPRHQTRPWPANLPSLKPRRQTLHPQTNP